jgi:ribosomal protein L11 methylase PrmA
MTTAHHTGVVSGEAAPLPDDAGAPLLPPAAWEEAAAQLDHYFRALGVDDAEHLQRLAGQVLHRLAAKPAVPEQLPQAAMEEAQGMLDEWLAQLLDLPDTRQRQQLAAARAALRFNRELADWSTAFLQKTTPAQLRSTLQAAVLSPVPPPRERAMEPQKIDFWHPLTGPVHALVKLIKRLLRH